MSRSRTGFTVLESCVAAALLAAALALCVSMLTSVARQRQAAGRHARAVLAADNLLARVTAEPYASLTAARASEICAASHVENMLPEADAKIEVAEAAGPPPAKKITVAVAWRTNGTGPAARHEVATWVFPPEGEP